MRRLTPWLIVLAFCLMLISVIAPSDVLAQDEGPEPTPSDDEVNAIAKQMFCPVCENIPLDVCSTQACAQWREQIREKLAQGWTEEEIKDYFVLLYGDRVLGAPPRRGLNWLIYVIPPAAFIVGGYILYRGLRSWQKPISEVVESIETLEDKREQDDYVSQLEKELRKRQ